MTAEWLITAACLGVPLTVRSPDAKLSLAQAQAVPGTTRTVVQREARAPEEAKGATVTNHGSVTEHTQSERGLTTRYDRRARCLGCGSEWEMHTTGTPRRVLGRLPGECYLCGSDVVLWVE